MTKKIYLEWTHLQSKVQGLSKYLLEADESEIWIPNTDVCEGLENVIIKVELPGVLPENLDIHLEDDAVVIRGVRPDTASEESAAGYKFSQLEIQYGLFQRVIRLPYPVDGERAKAQLSNGVLELRLPRARNKQPTFINVIVES